MLLTQRLFSFRFQIRPAPSPQPTASVVRFKPFPIEDSMSAATLPYDAITTSAADIRAGRLSPVGYTEALLHRIAALDERLHSFIRVTPERALAQAQGIESERKAGVDRGPLHGIPYAAKDLFDVKGLPTTAGTRLLADNIAEQDCTVVRKLTAAGMVLLGKTHTVQFAYGAAGLN